VVSVPAWHRLAQCGTDEGIYFSKVLFLLEKRAVQAYCLATIVATCVTTAGCSGVFLTSSKAQRQAEAPRQNEELQ
jgi:hypothetical protein